MKPGNFIDVFLARRVSGTYAHHQEHLMLSCSMWFSAPSFWMRGGLENRCVHGTIRTVNTTYAAALKATHHPSKNSIQKTVCCNSTSNAPDGGRMYPKYVELRIDQ